MDKHISVTFGRMNPITTGHAKLINAIQQHAVKHGGEHRVFVSGTHDSKKNPLTHSQKVGFLHKMLPTAQVHETPDVKTPIDMLKHLHKKGYTHVHMFVGSDRHQDMHNLVHHYNGEGEGKEYHFKHLEVHSAGERSNTHGVEGMSGTKMRNAAKEHNFKEFKKGVPSQAHAQELYHAVRKGMRLESLQKHKAFFIVGGPGSGKDFMVKGAMAETNILEISLNKLFSTIVERGNITEINEGRSIIVNGNADNLNPVLVSKAVLERLGYDTAMCYVYTTNEESKLRNDIRKLKGAKTISESIRRGKYLLSLRNNEEFAKRFNNYWQFDNSSDFEHLAEENKNYICHDLLNMSKEVAAFFEGKKPDPYRGMRKLPKDATPVPADSKGPGEPIIKGYERVKKGSFYVLQPKGGIQRESLDKAFENYSATATDDSRGNIDVVASNSPTENPQTVLAKQSKRLKRGIPGDKQTGISLSAKNMANTQTNEGKGNSKETAQKLAKAKKKTSTPPSDYFDSRMGAVPSGGVGLTSQYVPTKGKKLNEIRRKS